MILFIISLFGITCLISKTFKIPVALLPFVALPSIGLLLYMGALVDQLALTANMLITIGICSSLYECLIWGFSKRERGFHSTALFLIFITLIFAVLTKPLLYFEPDSFGFWGVVTKVLFETQALPNPHTPSFPYGFLPYPPGSNLFEYFALKANGAFSESLSIFCVVLLSISPFLSLFTIPSKRKALGLFLLSLLVLLNYNKMALSETYVDGILAAMAAGGFLVCFLYRECLYKILYLTPALAYLSLIKRSGILFAALILIFLLCDILSGFRKKSSNNQTKLKHWLLATIVIFSFYFSWNIHVANLHLATIAFNTDTLHTSTIFKQLFTPYTLPSSQFLIWKHFWLADLFMGHSFSLLHFITPALSLLIAIFLFLAVRKRKTEITKPLVSWFVILTATVVLYTLGLLILYLNLFSPREALRVASFGRYLGSFYSVLLTPLLVLFFNELTFKKTSFIQQSTALQLIWIIAASVTIIFYYAARYERQKLFYPERKIAVQVEKTFPNLTVLNNTLLIIQGSNGTEWALFRFLWWPASPNPQFDFSQPPAANHAALKKALLKAPYILFYQTDDAFLKNNQGLFRSPLPVATPDHPTLDAVIQPIPVGLKKIF